MSRKFKRFVKQTGLDKALDDYISITISESVKYLEEFKNYRFEVGYTEYDLEPLIILLPVIFESETNGIDIFKKEIYENIINRVKDDGKIYEKNPASQMGSLLSDLYEEMEDRGLKINLNRALEIARKLNLYDGDVGGYDFSILETMSGKSFFYKKNNDNKITLSQAFESAISIYCFKFFKQKNIPSDFMSTYIFVCSLEDEAKELNDVVKFIKVVMEYFLQYSIKDDYTEEDFPLKFNVSGDIKEDVKNINPDYLNILNCLNNDSLLAFTLCPSNEDDVFIDYYSKIFMYVLLDFSYKLLYINRRESLKELKAFQKAQLSSSLKEQKKLNKEIKSLKKTISTKENSIKALTKEINSLKYKNKENYYLKQIEELTTKLKNTENKLEGANLRIKNLEDKSIDRVPDVKELVSISLDEDDGTDVCSKIEVSYEEKVNVLKDKHFLVVGGNVNFFGRLKAVLPKSKHIDIVNEGCNFVVSKSTDCILNISKVTTHSHIKRAESQVRPNVPTIKISTYQVKEIINIIYDILIDEK